MAQARQDPALHSDWARFEPVIRHEVKQSWVEADRVALPLQHGTAEIVLQSKSFQGRRMGGEGLSIRPGAAHHTAGRLAGKVRPPSPPVSVPVVLSLQPRAARV